jgi:predicted SPOUT superfamily RNA methylase MTH1
MVVPLKRPFGLAIAVPASLTSDIPHPREKTLRIGLTGRAVAIFRVDEVIIYPDMSSENQRTDIKLIQTVLSYMETPQYLRRRLFRIVPELQYAGTLPPLRTPHHPIANRTESLVIGEYREGSVISHSNADSLVDIGVEQPAVVQRSKLKIDTRVTVKITDVGKRLRAALVDEKEIKIYWGYRVSVSDVSLGQLLKKRQFDLVIATSREGKPVTAVLDKLRESWRASRKTVVVFGAPTQGLYEIVGREHARLDDLAQFVVNTVPNQATETVRTEEAVYATLSILNMFNE